MELRSLGGIEGWGTRLLTGNDRDWSEVEGGLAGAVEVAVVRDAFAHGSRTIDSLARARLLAAGARTRPVGSAVTLPYTDQREFGASPEPAERGRNQAMATLSRP